MVFAAESLFSPYFEDRLIATKFAQTPPIAMLPKKTSFLEMLFSSRQKSRGDPPSPPPQPPPSPTGWTGKIVKDDTDVIALPGWY
ncbi:uncharacterized protein BDZ99DRAFT_515202 [Mytilinidion resinicola]|uniref:Uncharacterized protein n=1 Tax=Mytilinidion resinicola TaxID=574789 RepID=A0A6A6Z691_9PEZI|nr:uncharacterized protein BDZ99DRAFT_515202 [Mytilinidion resinicola]KAF2816622.1 hypothetical protein BDZ99DRAFT_515202 [Mytilinidion resinicola]